MARIAVIGAGMGAMATAARLATAGHRVTVYERTKTHGGSVGGFTREGFGFDTGPGLLHLPAVWRDFFVKTGKEPLERSVALTQVDPSSRHVFADGTAVGLPNASRGGVVSALDTALGAGSGERWGEFLGRARETWERVRRPLLEEPQPASGALPHDDPYPALRRGLLRRGARTLAEIGERELRDPRLAALLASYATVYGLDPRTAPASAAVLPYMEQTFGSWYVAGGVRALADAVHARCLARGVRFVFGSPVTGVVTRDGRVTGVETGAEGTVEADAVVSGAPVPSLYEEHVVGWERQEEWPHWQSPVRTGRVTVMLALSGGRPADAAHRTVVHPAGTSAEWAALAAGGVAERPTVTVLRPDDPLLRPDDGHEPVTLTATVPAVLADASWETAGPRVADLMVAAAEAAVPGLRERILWREVRTPDDIRAATGSASVPPPALAGAAGALLPAANTSPLPGLYFAGGWAHPGGGLAHAGMSGALVSGLIVEGAGFRGSQ
ncbi:phytoene desaturase family protein [Streptomyces genisteinicus]|uniref:NAD(P)/FAD-dependent oxidoreductase n=1 Tax=Streptomyces genisteinicus TaxID=2768068 RepID=A0A7H0HQQ4_9ACTN|nr:NAD(P)/FAD-dependent oxidoreductase [Streptomyces genisteinicus]QNP62870.1 NAD(P)/FAD-dependent oxidoreductase [Streptomyces genisteinicus]